MLEDYPTECSIAASLLTQARQEIGPQDVARHLLPKEIQLDLIVRLPTE